MHRDPISGTGEAPEIEVRVAELLHSMRMNRESGTSSFGKDGDPAKRLLALIFNAYKVKLAKLAYKYVPKSSVQNQDILDVVAEVYKKAYENLHNYVDQENSKILSWLSTILVNHCLDKYRKDSRRPPAFGEDANLVAKDESTIRRDIQPVLDKLDELSRTIFVMRYDEGRSFREISEILETRYACSPATLRAINNKTLEKLRKYLR